MDMKSLRRLLMRILVALVVLAAFGCVVGVGLWKYYIVDHPGPLIERSEIMKRIARESPVYYRDGTHRIGVFFGAEHREYLTYDEIPPTYVKALISAEDARFFEHPGVDVFGIARAMISNLRAGRIIAGGSTITQQTAKNLFHRPDRSLRSKWIELINALRLEAHYSKEEILEFYINQFHVYSNGRGLGIAARYFFDKDVSELTTLECAFLAGVVKGPYRYNPFVATTKEKREAAVIRATHRTHYVLDRMVANGYLDAEEAAKLKQEKLEFHEGSFQFDRNVILDHVFNVLHEPNFVELFRRYGIDDASTAGLQVVTTIDRATQRAALYGLRHHLTTLGTILEGLSPDAFTADPSPLMPIEADEIVPHRFYSGRIASIRKKPRFELRVDLGGIEGRVDEKGLERIAEAVKKGRKKSPWITLRRADVENMLDAFEVGRKVEVSVREWDGNGEPLLDLELRPELQGALVVLDRSRIRAMVGGTDNRNYNRVTRARRQLGSTFKPLIYAAALSLGWRSLAPLDNRRQGFLFQRRWYWPHPDHKGVQPFVSMAYAGAGSENLASISLLYHLTDVLSDEQILDLADKVGMAPKPGESEKAWGRRLRDRFGVIPTEASLTEGLYERIKGGLKTELVFEGRAHEAESLTWLPYGRGFSKELRRTERSLRRGKERDARVAFLRRSFLNLEALAPKALEAASIIIRSGQASPFGFGAAMPSVLGVLLKKPGETSHPDLPSKAEIDAASSHFYTVGEGDGSRIVYSLHANDAWHKPGLTDLQWLLSGRKSARDGVRGEEPSSGEWALSRSGEGRSGADTSVADKGTDSGPDLDYARGHILLDDVLAPSTVSRIRRTLDEAVEQRASLDRYARERVIVDRDFRVMVGLRYVMAMAAEMGVKSPLAPVLSMALGSKEITLLESALMYQTFLDGTLRRFDGGGSEAAIIQEIRDAAGHVIYRMPSTEHVFLDRSVGPRIGRILRAVFERGTARRGRKAVPVRSWDAARDEALRASPRYVPLFGKTGTTNDYLNAAFVGYLPVPTGGELRYGEALTLAAYVGYDDNRPLTRGSIRIHGATGALPAWLLAASDIVRDLDLDLLLDVEPRSDTAELPIAWPPEMVPVAVDARTGLRIGLDVLSDDVSLEEGEERYDLYGRSEEGMWREVEVYRPFLPWPTPPDAGSRAVADP